MNKVIDIGIKQRFCYFVPPGSFVKGQGMRVSIIKEGVSGHFPTGEWPCPPGGKMPWFWGDQNDEIKAVLQADLCAYEMNVKLGLSEEDVNKILVSSISK